MSSENLTEDMNIPPLISRTPPPINDAVDDEDEEEDDNSSFPRLSYCNQKFPDKSPDILPVVPSEGLSEIKRSFEAEESNGIDIPSKTEFLVPNTYVPSMFSTHNQKEETNVGVTHHYQNEMSLNGKCVSTDEISINRKVSVNDISVLPPLENLSDQGIENDWNDDFSCFQSCQTVVDSSHSRKASISSTEENIQNDDKSLSPISGFSFTSNQRLKEEIPCGLDDVIVSNNRNYCDDNLKKVSDIRLVEGEETVPQTSSPPSNLNNGSYCENKFSFVDKVDSFEPDNLEDENADSPQDNDSEFGEYKFESAVPSETIDINSLQPPSSQITSEFDGVNFTVTKESESPALETSCQNIEDEGCSAIVVAHDEKSDIIQDFPSEPVAGEFCASFPDVVQNYQLGQPSNDSINDDEFSDFVECSYEPSSEHNMESDLPIEPREAFIEDSAEENISPILLLCLKEEMWKTNVWKKLSSLEHTPALDYRWGNSYSSSRLLSALKIDSRNILSGHWTKSMRKLPSDDYRGNIDHIGSYPEICFNKGSVPHPQFEWVGSGLINPLDDGVSTRVKKSSVTVLSREAENLIASFPDLSYLKQSFIVFPKNIN